MDGEFPAEAIAQARDAVKAHLRASGDTDDVIAAQAASALALCEAFLGQAVIVREVVETVAADGSWQQLAFAPVRAITAVAGVGPDGTVSVLASGAFAVDIDARGEGWVRVRTGGVRRAQVTYSAGLASDWDELPGPVAQGVVLLAAHVLNGATDEPPAAVTALWRPWRRMRLSGGHDARA